MRSKHKLNLTALSTQDRHKDIDAIKNAISESGGSILNFTMYSDIGMGLNIEIEECDISGLYAALGKFLILSEPLPDDLRVDSEVEWWVLMHVSFAKGSGDVKAKIPNVPG